MTTKYTNVYLNNYYSLLGSDFKSPSIKNSVDKFISDYYFNSKNLVDAEINYQKYVINGLLEKSNLEEKNINLLISGDLQNNLVASNFASTHFNIQYLGIYSACSTFVEGLIIGSNFIKGKIIKNAIVATSSHNLICETQFRYPIEYGSLKKLTNTITVTGSASCLISSEKSNIKIDSSTIGKSHDIGYNDTNNLGAAMAISVGETFVEHLKDTKRKSNYYDLILTGDLGIYGLEILKDYVKEKYDISITKVKDAGVLVYDMKKDDNFAGGSGPVCLPLGLFNKIIKNKKYKRILLLGSGSLHSGITSKLKKTIPSISHALSLEVNHDIN